MGILIIQYRLKFILIFFACLAAHAAEPGVRISTVATNGMPKDSVPKGSAWNFGPGSLLTHKGWQYAAYWDDARQVSVARRKLPTGDWPVVSLPGYQRSASGDRGKGGAISRGFGDTWKNNDGKVIGKRGQEFITADSPGVKI
jgi:hypothetical protein